MDCSPRQTFTVWILVLFRMDLKFKFYNSLNSVFFLITWVEFTYRPHFNFNAQSALIDCSNKVILVLEPILVYLHFFEQKTQVC